MLGRSRYYQAAVSMWALAWFIIWLRFRGVMNFVGIWHYPKDYEAVAGKLQILNAAYMLMTDGLLVLLLLALFMLIGFCFWRLIAGPPQQSFYRSDSLLIAGYSVVLGLLYAVLTVLFLGVIGQLQRDYLLVLWLLPACTALSCFWRDLKSLLCPDPSRKKEARAHTTPPSRPSWLIWLIVPLLMLSLMAALLPEGILWNHDGKGYDSLEYHLQLPREYAASGRVAALPHNSFSHLPANAEMLYLAAMIIKGNPIAGMYLARLFNWTLTLMVVLFTYCHLRRTRPDAALWASCAMAGPQLVFIATNTYVEAMMLLFFIAALAVVTDENITITLWRRWLVAGIFIGGACGCKYPALLMMAPVVASLLLLKPNNRVRGLTYFAIGVLAAFSPWLIKNTVETGNPVFPQARQLFGSGPWTPQQQQRWDIATSPRGDDQTAFGKIKALTREIVSPRCYGGLLFITVLSVIVNIKSLRSSRRHLWLIAVIVWQLLVWLLLTHLQSRFLLPLIIPAALLIGSSSLSPSLAPIRYRLMSLTVAVVILLHTVLLWNAYNRSTALAGPGPGFWPLVQRDDVIAAAYPFGNSDPQNENVHVLLVGEARPFYVKADYRYHTVFDPSELAAQFRHGGPKVVMDWLKHQQFTHVYVNWAEINRLRQSYGYDEEISPDSFTQLEKLGLIKCDTMSRSPYETYYAVPR